MELNREVKSCLCHQKCTCLAGYGSIAKLQACLWHRRKAIMSICPLPPAAYWLSWPWDYHRVKNISFVSGAGSCPLASAWTRRFAWRAAHKYWARCSSINTATAAVVADAAVELVSFPRSCLSRLLQPQPSRISSPLVSFLLFGVW